MKKAIIGILMIPLMFGSLTQCSSDDGAVPKKTFVLVHGAWQGPYVWQYVQQQLENDGQKVIVVELPAHGSDMTSPAEVSVDVYRDKVVDAIEKSSENVILVGHSMGGVVVSAVAEKIPSRIEKLVYIGAFVPTNGQSLLDLAGQDAQSQLGASLLPSEDQLLLDVKPESIVTIFCQDVPAEMQQLVLDNFRPEPAIPFTNKVTLTEANFGHVDKYYIHTLQDHAIGIDLQNQMASAAHVTKEFSLDTGHSPFLSKPEEVANIFMEIIK